LAWASVRILIVVIRANLRLNGLMTERLLISIDIILDCVKLNVKRRSGGHVKLFIKKFTSPDSALRLWLLWA